MKFTIRILTSLIVLIAFGPTMEANPFDKVFNNRTLRIDYFHKGDSKSESIKIDKLYFYDQWAGSKTNLIDDLNYGAYQYKVLDEATKELIFLKGFDSYFKEYQTSTPALEGEVKQFHESALIPFPKKPVLFILEKRDNAGQFIEVYRQQIDPDRAKAAKYDAEIKVITSHESGPSQNNADIAFIAEGYTKKELPKFEKDLQRFTEIFFQAEPLASHKDQFNIRGIFKPSKHSGIDEPRDNINKKTAVNATFNSMGSARYVLTEDNKNLRNIAGHAPYDALVIMVNQSRYGGGGIYNFFCVFTTDNVESPYLLVHEFGHSFFGLADEYYSSSTAYNDFYVTDIEPSEPNITALLDPENLKWKHLLDKDLDIPTPWNKTIYDSLDLAWDEKSAELNDQIIELQNNGAPERKIWEVINIYNQLSDARIQEKEDFIKNSGLEGKTGAFEGAGYMYNGLYRPSINCIMFTQTDYFCPVCRDAMKRVIKSYSK